METVSDFLVGIDIGGTLVKVCVLRIGERRGPTDGRLEQLEIDRASARGQYSFHKFPSSDIARLIGFLRDEVGITPGSKLHMTGGGAHKFEAEIIKALDVEVIKLEEMRSLAKGIEFLVRRVEECLFHYSPQAGRIYLKNKDDFPFLLVNIGSGVSILRFTAYDEHQRVTGTALGGATFMGLCNLAIGESDFEALLADAEKGDNTTVDLTMSDISKGIDSPLRAERDILAVSLGRFRTGETPRREDVAKSLLNMIAYNIAQVAFLTAKLHGLHNVLFAGNFIRNHDVTMHSIVHAVELFSTAMDYKVDAKFLKHDGFIGALGAIRVQMGVMTPE